LYYSYSFLCSDEKDAKHKCSVRPDLLSDFTSLESTVRFSFLVLLLVYGIMSNNTLFCAPEGPYLSFAGAKVRQLFELTKYYTDFFWKKIHRSPDGGLRAPLYLFIFTYTLMRGRGEYQIRLPFVLSRADGNEVAAGLIGILEVNSHNLLTPAYIRILRILFICAYICIFSN